MNHLQANVEEVTRHLLDEGHVAEWEETKRLRYQNTLMVFAQAVAKEARADALRAVDEVFKRWINAASDGRIHDSIHGLNGNPLDLIVRTLQLVAADCAAISTPATAGEPAEPKEP